MSVEPSLSLTQFRTLMQTVADMIRRVEEEQKSKLQNVQALQEEQRSSLQMTLASAGETSAQSAATVEPFKSCIPPSGSTNNFADSMKSPQMATTMTPRTSTIPASGSVNSFADSMMSPQMAAPVAKPPTASGFVDSGKSPQMAAPMVLRTGTSAPLFADSVKSPQMATPMAPMATRPAWTPVTAGSGGNDAFNSMIRSNLSAMSVLSPTGPVNPWPSGGFQNNLNWNSGSVVGLQPKTSSLVPQFHQLSINAAVGVGVQAGPVPLIPSPSVPAAASAVRPLARSDIDDLLS